MSWLSWVYKLYCPVKCILWNNKAYKVVMCNKVATTLLTVLLQSVSADWNNIVNFVGCPKLRNNNVNGVR